MNASVTELKKPGEAQYWDALVMREDVANKKTYWTRVGRAFVNKDGSFNILLDALPLGGKLQIRPHTEKPSQADNAPHQHDEPWAGAPQQ